MTVSAQHPAQLQQQQLIHLSSICPIAEICNFEYIQHFEKDSLFLFTTSCQYSVRLTDILILSLLGFAQAAPRTLVKPTRQSYTYNRVVKPELV